MLQTPTSEGWKVRLLPEYKEKFQLYAYPDPTND